MAQTSMMRMSLSCSVSSSPSSASPEVSAAGARISSVAFRATALPLSSSSLRVGHHPGRKSRRTATSAVLGLETETELSSGGATVASPAVLPAKWADDSSLQGPAMEVNSVTEAELKENGFRSTRRTKLVCTIGPATCALEQLEALAMGGMNVARLNMCHGTRGWHSQVIRNVRSLNSEKGFSVAVMMVIPRAAKFTLPTSGLPRRSKPRVVKSGSSQCANSKISPSELLLSTMMDSPKMLELAMKCLWTEGWFDLK